MNEMIDTSGAIDASSRLSLAAGTDASSGVLGTLRVAIVHEWLEVFAGSERVLEQLIACFPQADLFAVVDFMSARDRRFLGGRPVRTSFIQRLPFARKRFRHYLGLMPLAIEQFDLTGYDLIVSSNHAVAKGVITGPEQLHVSYVHSPMRYAWDLQGRYLKESGLERGLRGLYVRWLLHRLRQWDARSSAGVDLFVANSRYIAERIRKAYRREATVLAPPVATEMFSPDGVPGMSGPREDARVAAPDGGREDFYLVASRFVPYKRIDLIVDAFAAMPSRRLVVVGEGTGADAVRRAAAGHANIEIRKPVGGAELVALMRRARAFVFAAEEDFGITMAEAQSCGTPVIAYGVGGARDIVIDGHGAGGTGVLFAEQSVGSLCDAVDRFEREEAGISPASCRANALRFAEPAFRAAFRALVAAELGRKRQRRSVRADLASLPSHAPRVAEGTEVGLHA